MQKKHIHMDYNAACLIIWIANDREVQVTGQAAAKAFASISQR